ncbi:MAG: hypothetical protein KatS3mg027_0295 [Bacteroidia bacterium]|nr:MAG: hypothetical protein KatS3mg027_0295 [Bacteroidia bacterium]
MIKDDELTLTRTNYTSNQLRIDGYYYQKLNNNFFSIYCFYRNGVLLATGGVFSSIQDMDKYLYDEFINRQEYKNYKSNWGGFLIQGNSMKFERWYPSDPPLKAYVRAGTILNDTTFIITEVYRMKDGSKTEVQTLNEIYHFKSFKPKPDSTNKFIN